MISINLNLSGLRGLVTKTQLLKAGDYEERLFRTLAVSLIPLMRYRIHVEGFKSDETAIGRYSTTYLEYRQKRPFNRTPDRKVVLSLTRQMENDLSVVPDNKGTYGVGFKNNAIYGSSNRGLDSESKLISELNKRSKAKKAGKTPGKIRTISNLQKAMWMEEMYGDIYNPTESEKEVLKRVAEKFIDEIGLVR